MSHDAAHPRVSFDSRWTAGRRPLVMLLIAAGVGAAAVVAHAARSDHGYRRFMLAYLVAFAFILSLSLGGLFFVFIQHLTHAGWSVLIRRFAETLAANMPIVAVLFVPIAVSILFGHGEVYPWAGHGGEAGHAANNKAAYLNPTFFVARWAAFLAIWSVMALFFWRHSTRQDADGDHHHTIKMERIAAPAAIILGLTLTLGAFDLLMSLDPHWYSTMFGVYYFIGGVVGALAAIILLVLGLQRAGMLTRAIGQAHYLDLGRLLFAFMFFWAYIAFSQYMLLWYANMPETTGWLRTRGISTAHGDANAWSWVAIVLLFGHFLIPFAVLMSRHVKARPGLLALAAGWMLVMHYLDLAWIVMPELGQDLYLGMVEWGTMLAVAAVYLIAIFRRLSRHSLVPLGDPRIPESAAHESVY